MAEVHFGYPGDYDLFIAGDFCPLSDRLNQELIFEPDLAETLRKARFITINLECPLTSHPHSIKKTGPALKAPSSALELLSRLDVNMVNLANNHIMDYGARGAMETLSALEGLGIQNTGLNKVGEESPLVVNIGDFRVAFVSFTENEFSTIPRDDLRAHPQDHFMQLVQIRQARADADLVVVQYHGGAEGYPYPSPGQQNYARYLVELGASLVICHHSHCFSGYEVYKDVPIFYGLGNFYFPKDHEPSSFNMGLGLCVTLKNPLEVDVIGVKLDMSNGLLSNTAEDSASAEVIVTEINAIINSEAKLQTEWESFCAATKGNSLSIVNRNTRFNKILKRFGINRDMTNQIDLGLLNRIRCETHRERLLSVLMAALKEKSRI